jgi:hypothetical protein
VERLTDRTASEQIELLEPYTVDEIEHLRSLLNAADQAAGDDASVRRRIAFLRHGLDFTELQAEAFRLCAQARKKPLDAAGREAARALLGRKWLFMRDLFRKEPLAVNMGSTRWGETTGFYELGNEIPVCLQATREAGKED